MRRLRRAHVLTLLGTSAVAAAALASTAASLPGPPLPDLVSEAPQFDEAFPYPALDQHGDGRLLLRFNGFVTNNFSAPGPLEIRASNPDAGDVMQSVEQWGGSSAPGVGGTKIATGDGGPAVVRYESADGHNHYHLKNAAEYALFTEDKTALVALAQKTQAGFCLEDSLNAGGGAAVYDVDTTNFCWRDHQKGTGSQTVLVMGISPGWKDRYGAELSYQWVDVSNVSPGKYQLASRVDPTNIIRESDESNNGYKYLAYTLPGYVAQPVSIAQTGAAKTVTLSSQTFGSPGGSRQFKIISAPAHGTLSQPVGAVFSGTSVTYTPKAGYLGSDSFSYAAVTAGFGYPVNPPAAAVSVAGNSISVAISGAPASLVAGTSAQLSAAVANAPGGVTWSTSAGTVSPTGLYVAPKPPPGGGSATVTARSVENPDAQATATIAITPAAPAAPAPGITGDQSAGAKMLSALKVGRIGNRTLVGRVVTGAGAGRLTVTATLGRSVLGRCAKRAPARTSVVCKITFKRSYPLKKVTVTAKLTVGSKSAVRRASLPK